MARFKANDLWGFVVLSDKSIKAVADQGKLFIALVISYFLFVIELYINPSITQTAKYGIAFLLGFPVILIVFGELAPFILCYFSAAILGLKDNIMRLLRGLAYSFLFFDIGTFIASLLNHAFAALVSNDLLRSGESTILTILLGLWLVISATNVIRQVYKTSYAKSLIVLTIGFIVFPLCLAAVLAFLIVAPKTIIWYAQHGF